MYRSIILLLAISFSLNAMAQGRNQDNECTFFKNISFKNGKHTIVIKATYHTITKLWPATPQLEALDKERRANKDEFTYAIYFKPDNCSKEYSGPCSYKGAINLSKMEDGTSFYVTCLVFRKYEFNPDGTPFFLVTQITLKQPH